MPARPSLAKNENRYPCLKLKTRKSYSLFIDLYLCSYPFRPNKGVLPPSHWVKKSNFPPKHPKQDEKNSRHFLMLTSVDLPQSRLKLHIEGRQGVLTILAQATRLEILCRNKLVVERPATKYIQIC